MLIFLDFNTQKDLVYDLGRYPVPGANELLVTFANISEFIKLHKDAVHISFNKVNQYGAVKHLGEENKYKEFPSDTEPRHCERLSTGGEKIVETVSSMVVSYLPLNEKLQPDNIPYFVQFFLESANRFQKPYMVVEHNEWDVFSNNKFAEILDEIGEQLKEPPVFILYGVPGDRTILNFVKRLYAASVPGQIVLLTDAIRNFDQKKAPDLFAKLQDKVGAQLLTANELLGMGTRKFSDTRKYKPAPEPKPELKTTEDTFQTVGVVEAKAEEESAGETDVGN